MGYTVVKPINHGIFFLVLGIIIILILTLLLILYNTGIVPFRTSNQKNDANLYTSLIFIPGVGSAIIGSLIIWAGIEKKKVQ